MALDMNKVKDLANEVTKDIDVKKVAAASTANGKVDVKKAADAVKSELTAEEAKNIAAKAKNLL